MKHQVQSPIKSKAFFTMLQAKAEQAGISCRTGDASSVTPMQALENTPSKLINQFGRAVHSDSAIFSCDRSAAALVLRKNLG